jgi:uncharacterized protein involved in exopolysaccharide biosynthesis
VNTGNIDKSGGGDRAQYLVIVPPSSGEASVNFGELVRLLLKRSWLIVLAAFVVGGLSAIYAFNEPNVYRASAIVAIRTGQDAGGADLMRSQLGGLASIAGVNLGAGGGERDELVAALTSRSLSERFIREKQLIDELFEADRTPDGRWKKGPPTVGEAVDRWLEDVLVINEDRKTRLVSVSVEGTDRERAAQWANAYVELANRTARARQIEDASRTIEYLRQQIAANPLEGVRQSLYRLIENNINRVALAKVRKDHPYAFIDRATPPEPKKKIWPKRTTIILLGAAMGALLSALAIMMLDRARFMAPATQRRPAADDKFTQQDLA